jgi:pilus assembly protein Flp/PilA
LGKPIDLLRSTFDERPPAMRTVREILRRFLRGEDGPTAVEYAVMLAMIIMVCFVAIGLLGSQTNELYHADDLQKAMNKAP